MTKDSQSIGQDGDRLDSWKEIAAYLGKDVRTALRWSKDEGMPVYRHAEGKRGAIYAYRSEIDEWIHSDRSVSPQAYRKPVFVWIGAVTVLVLAAAAAHLWLNLSTDQPNAPVGEPTWVLITDFDNRSGEPRFDGTVETALRRELANSRHVLVVAPEKVRDTLALMKRAPDEMIDAELGREICLRYGDTCVLLTGRVEKFDLSYLLSLEVVDPADGRTVASAEEEATGESEVLPAIHRLGNWLRGYLGEDLAQIDLTDERLEQVTTPSLRALELYSKGMQLMSHERPADAEVLFRQAVEVDPEFASANLFVFWALNNQEKYSAEAQSFLMRALELADSTSEQERYFIKGVYYGFTGNIEEACRTYKILVELFPDHYWAVGNAAFACGKDLGNREEYVRYLVLAAEQRLDLISLAGDALSLLGGDFDQARPYVERLRGLITDGEIPVRAGTLAVAFTEFFAAEENLHKGLLPDVVSELQRVELALEGSMDSPSQQPTALKLFYFYLALGQFRKARALSQELQYPFTPLAWCAFLKGDKAAFRGHVEDFHAFLPEVLPDPTERLIYMLQRNIQLELGGVPPFDALIPLYDPESAVEMASPVGGPSPMFLDFPNFKVKLQMARGKQMLDQGNLDEGIVLLRSSVGWLRDYGDWNMFPYYFLGVELLAEALAERGDLEAAYKVLEDAAGQRYLVNSFSAPLHQRIQARLALLSRELGHTAEAEAIEAELEEALIFADQDHPILVQIREQQDVFLEFE